MGSDEINPQNVWVPDVKECQVHLEFLETVVSLKSKVEEWSKSIDADGAEVWDMFVTLAAERFHQWVKEKDDSLPPLDVLIVWHAFMLNPRDYLRFEKLVVQSRWLEKGMDWTALHQSLKDESIAKTPSTRFPDLLASLKSEVITKEDFLKRMSNTRPLPLFDLVAAVHRQFKFAKKMCSYNWLHSPFMHATLSRAVSRYEKFFSLIAANPGKSLAPTLDIDLVWHTHQLSPAIYRAYSKMKTGGKFINHDDTIEQDLLVTSSGNAEKLFQDRYGEEYFICLCEPCEASRADISVKGLETEVKWVEEESIRGRQIMGTCQDICQKRPDSPPRGPSGSCSQCKTHQCQSCGSNCSSGGCGSS